MFVASGRRCRAGDECASLLEAVPSSGTSYSGEVNLDVERLLADREEQLQVQLAELTKPAGELGAISFGKRVGEGTSMAVDRLAAVSAQEHLLAMLEQVRRARRRVADGTYGICEVCGQPVPEERLEVRPWAVRCVQHS
jgi:RNA polymerase-binding transcription factor